MALTRIVEPAIEPVSLEEAKAALNLDADLTQDDALIGVLITAAREYAEAFCNRSFITQQWKLTLDEWPANVVRLERGPIQSVDQISYVDMARNVQTITNPGSASPVTTVANEQKQAVTIDGPTGRIAPAFGYILPIVLPQIGAINITFTTGYGAAPENVPAGIRGWIKMRVATLYQNREEVAVMPRGKVEALPYVDKLLDPWVVVMA